MKQHILCFGDSNTHGYCADSTDCADPQFMRFNEDERWTMRLQKALGDDYLIIEEGLSGRTTVFHDPIHEGLCGIDYIHPCMNSHSPLSLIVVMLGTNDTKERMGASAAVIALGLRRLVTKMVQTPCWAGTPNVLIVAPPPIKAGLYTSAVTSTMGAGCVEKSRLLAVEYAKIAKELGCHFLDASTLDAAFNDVDFMHLTRDGHRAMADGLARILPELL